ncbi:twin-arginine translocation pathway signal [Curvibacter sp. HBC61]|uniref:Twin-arginine translocation pathway signal n=1 Tax=Curvibacter cyanobacteriorum TaxID=3026422 RepID=A0ABT5N2J9_9BURK|nr:alpha/beta fold hydrolase [Curvibacter sp. HBC61]MDD0840540.1 twin-arginine translocation pathway signal [Curvibacter sp. HBC61]
MHPISSRRRFLGLALGAAALATGCAAVGSGKPSLSQRPPVVFVHGNGDTAALWQTTAWRFESEGWPADRLHAIDLPYPLSRDVDAVAQPGRTSAAEHMAYLKAEVERVLAATGASQVVLIGNSRGGNAIRNYIQNGGGADKVSHAILGGTPNHGVWAVAGVREGNEFSGTGPFLTALNAPKNAAGDEVTGPVRWMTIRSDNNDKYAVPEGRWIGMPGQPTGVTAAGPELKGATNVVIPRIDHRETSYSRPAFEAMWRFLTGEAPRQHGIVVQARPVLQGKVTGLGVNPLDPKTGNFSSNLPLPGARVEVFAVNPETGRRQGAAVHQKTVGSDGLWGPFTAEAGQPYEFVISAPGYATTHIYRSAFARGSDWVHLRAERLTPTDSTAGSVLVYTRPRGYFDPSRDSLSLDGSSTLPGVPATGTAGFSSSRLVLAPAPLRSVKAEFNGEVLVGLNWPANEQHLVVLELTY